MADPKKPSQDGCTSVQAYTLAGVCLFVGVAGGWLVRGSQAPAAVAAAAVTTPDSTNHTAQPNPGTDEAHGGYPGGTVAGKFESRPRQSETAGERGKCLLRCAAVSRCDRLLPAGSEREAGRFVDAHRHGHRVLVGDADTAIAEFNRALAYEPNQPNALFNLGVVEWQGKMNVDGALAAWQKLLDSNPNYENKARLLELMAQVKKHSGLKPGTQAKTQPD